MRCACLPIKHPSGSVITPLPLPVCAAGAGVPQTGTKKHRGWGLGVAGGGLGSKGGVRGLPPRVLVTLSGGYRPGDVCSFLFQSSTRQSRVVEIGQTKAVRISCCFSFQSSISRTRGLASSTTPAPKPPARRCAAIASSGGRPPSKSCTKPTTAKRTPARRSERRWWRSATGNGRPSPPKTRRGAGLTARTPTAAPVAQCG